MSGTPLYSIVGYNGRLPMAIRAQLSGIANEVVGEDKWLFDGPIEKLLKHMNRPIMIMPEQRIIYVTQYSTFSQR